MSVNWLMQRILDFRHRGDPPPGWEDDLRGFKYDETLSAAEKQRLIQLARTFESVVRFDGAHGFEVTDRMRRVVSLEACRLVLALGYEPLRYVHRVTLFEQTFVMDTREGERTVLGAAESGGHVALSWREAERGTFKDDDGRNVIYHEFAHILDGYDGRVDGRPHLIDRADIARWNRVVSRSFRQLQKAKRRRALIDEYGATSVVEFFAEATETFFEHSVELREQDPDLYAAMAGYFQQDPAAWFDAL